MTKAQFDLGIEVIKYTFEKLPLPAQLRVVEDLERQTRRQRWDQVISRVRERVAKDPIPQKEIDILCAEARQLVYEKRTKSRH